MRIRDILAVFMAVLFFACGLISAAEEEKEYYALYMDGKKVGHAIRSRQVREQKVTTTEEVTITMKRAGKALTLTTTESCIESPQGKPIGFISVLGTSKVTGSINDAGMVELTDSSMGSEQKSTIPWPEGSVMSEGLRLIQEKHGLKEGTIYDVNVFTPFAKQAFKTEITIGEKKKIDLLGRVVTLTEVKSKIVIPLAGEMESIAYVDDELKAQKSITPMMGINLEMLACEKEFALSDVEAYEVIDKALIKSPVPIEDVSKAESITYYLKVKQDSNSPLEENKKIILEAIPSTDNQTVRAGEDDQIIIIVQPIKAPAGAKFPYKGNDQRLLAALKPARYIQSDNAKIIELAKQAVGDTKDAAQAAKKIEEFVANYISNTGLSVGYASAAEVAESRQGDCSEFAVLTAALCRAAGIPAEIVMGMAYVKEWRDFENCFGGHAWVQAYVGGKWVGLDAAFKSAGLGGFDAGHIAQAVGNGDPEDFFSLIGSFGRFEIEKLQIKNSK
jgi:hypothetical protein